MSEPRKYYVVFSLFLFKMCNVVIGFVSLFFRFLKFFDNVVSGFVSPFCIVLYPERLCNVVFVLSLKLSYIPRKCPFFLV